MKAGETFLGGGEVHGSHHLWVVLNDPAAHEGEAVIVKVSTLRPGAETTCVLSKGEHPFIKHDSYVRYQSDRKTSVAALQAAVKAGLLKSHTGLNVAVLARIRAGAQASPQLPLELRKLLELLLVPKLVLGNEGRTLKCDLARDGRWGLSNHMSITAIVEGGTIKLPSGVHVPDGTPVRLDLPEEGTSVSRWPVGYFERTAGALAGELFERPVQGEVPQREAW